ncbi:MAG TPA: putative O-glycosylation ligase, exosortase A system-associated [Phycisphaerae bacterium]|nr:putative O-glycosylation ligase, exosortase A system-associated [Phycisphaerae bacterium]HPS52228.1 putative O-glycosylation ligase, exosortase A system-associated [Phycisphaerae bacterium]
MGIRDILMTLLGWGCIPVALMDAYYGLLAYCWLSLMKPQSLVWSSSVQENRFVLATAVCMLVRTLTTPLPWWRPKGPAVWFLLFWIWMTICGYLSPNRQAAMEFVLKFTKIAIALMLITGLVRTKEQLKQMVILLAMCPGIYAIRLGLFLLRGGGVTHNGGPLGMDNNDTALFIAMGIPMLLFASYEVQHKWASRGLKITALLAIPAIISGASRGGMLAMSIAVAITLWRKFGFIKMILGTLVLGVIALVIIPQATLERYMTIKSYKQDESAMGRIWAWQVARKMADRNPLFGIGLGQTPFIKQYPKYQVHEEDHPHVAHSVWFTTMAGSGYVGLFFYVMMLTSVLLMTRKIRKLTEKGLPDGKNSWAWHYAAMIEATVAAFCVGATFLSQVGFEYVYAICVLTTALWWVTQNELSLAANPLSTGDMRQKEKKNVGLYPLPA